MANKQGIGSAAAAALEATQEQRRKNIEAQARKDSRVRCRVQYPTRYQIICKQTKSGPFYMMKQSLRYPELRSTAQDLMLKDGWKYCEVVNVMDYCIGAREGRDDYLHVHRRKPKK